MKPSIHRNLLAVGVSLTVLLQLGEALSASSNSSLPSCALNCIPKSIAERSCAGNTTCWCELDEALDAGEKCLAKSCPVPVIITSRRPASDNCPRSRRDKSTEYQVVNYTLGIITAVAIFSRLIFKRFVGAARKFSPDDWAVLAAFAVGVPCAFLNRFGVVPNGIGRDAWTLDPGTVSDFAFYFYVLEVLYTAAVALIKMSFLVFYFSIFTGTSARAWTRPLLWLAVVFDVLLGIISVCVAALQCLPVSYYWTRYKDETATGHCIPIEPLAFANGALSVALDLMMILIPLAEVVQMQMHWKKKAGVIFMFLLGTFVTIVSTLRLLSVSQFSELVNITWKFYSVALWSTVEINVGLLCTCLPTLRLILVRISPRVFGSRWSRAGTRLGSSSTGSHFSRKTSAGNPAVLYPNLEDIDASDDPRESEPEQVREQLAESKEGAV